MKEIGIDGGSIGRMSDVVRDAKDLDAIARNRLKDESKRDEPPARKDDD
jgi:hypothetical protein